jgi:hypothetical protein
MLRRRRLNEAARCVPKSHQMFCPTCQARHAKINFFPKERNYDLKKLSRAHRRARRHRHERGARDAMDALVSQASDIGAYGQAEWS